MALHLALREVNIVETTFMYENDVIRVKMSNAKYILKNIAEM